MSFPVSHRPNFRKHAWFTCLWIACPWVSSSAAPTDNALNDASGSLSERSLDFFERKVRPVLAEHCYSCHNSVGKKKGGLALDYRGGWIDTGAIVPGEAAESPLLQAIRHEGDLEPMPYKAPKLANVIIKNIEEWVRMGAPDPRLEKPSKEELEREVDWESVRERRKTWWSFQAPRKVEPPPAESDDWNDSAVDRFLYQGLKANGLEPQGLASPGALVRRLHLILTGLPPTPEVVEAFVVDPSEEAYAELVDGLIGSRAYGERWARYWLDWFRYAESYGSEGDPAVPYARQYRDYVIRAIEDDVPYDQLVREHLAGDLLDEPRINEALGLNESAIGPAYIRMSPHGFGVTDAYDEQITFTDNQIDVISKSMLGLTVSCARCHNHKFDPISQEDYYKFYGILISSRPAIVNVDSPKLQNLHRDALESLKATIRQSFAAHWGAGIDAAVEKLAEAKLADLPEHHPFHAWSKLREEEPEALRQKLTAMRRRYEDTLRRNEKIKQEATFYADLRKQETYERWFKSGNGLGSAVSPGGSFAVATEGEQALLGIYPAGVYSHLISDKHNGFLNSLFHLADGNYAAVRALGDGGAIARFTLRSYPLSHGGLHPAPQLKPTLGWVQLRKYKYWSGEKGYFQVNTGPDSTFKGQGGRSWFGLLEVYGGKERPTETGAPLVALPGNLDEVVDRATLLAFYRGSLRDAVGAWRDGNVNDAQAQLLDAFVQRNYLTNRIPELPEELRVLVERYRKLENEIRVPARAPGVVEGETWNQPLLVRGDYKQEDDVVERAFLEVFPGPPYGKTESGRRELAEDILAERNTLTARVIVNRLWHHVFGRGIVPSADNFGRLGDRPSHPELLDYLALDFRERGWSMQRTVRQLVMTRAFRSASIAPDASGSRDPENAQLAYFSPRRLDAEAIFDAIRFVADNKVEQRAIYNSVRRNALHPFLTTFNFPIPTTTVGVRSLTDVPAQSLTLLNGDLSRNAARRWSERVVGDSTLNDDRARVGALFLQAYARAPSEAELGSCLAYLARGVVDDSAELAGERARLIADRDRWEEKLEAIVAPVRARLEADMEARRRAGTATPREPADLQPIGRWDFEGDGRDLVGEAHGELKGAARIADGALILEGGALMTSPISTTLKEKTLEVLVQLDSLDQRGGGAMTLQGLRGRVFDSVVFAEVAPREWLAGSDHHHRTSTFGGSEDNDAAERPVRVTVVYQADGTTQGYRDGKPYGNPFRKGTPVTFKKGEAQIVFGLRHGTAPPSGGSGGGRVLRGKVFEARLYDRALTAAEVAMAANFRAPNVVTTAMLRAALDANARREVVDIEAKLDALKPAIDRLERELEEQRRLHEASGGPYFRLAHAILCSKEFIYVY